MVYKNILLALIFVSLFFETTIFSFPLVFVFSLVAYILYPEIPVIIAAVLAGLILDALKVSTIGATPVVTIFAFFIIEVFQKALAIKDFIFIFVFMFAASYLYAVLFSYSNNLALYLFIYGLAGFATFYSVRKAL